MKHRMVMLPTPSEARRLFPVVSAKGDMEQPAIAGGDKPWFANRMGGGQDGSDLWYMRKDGTRGVSELIQLSLIPFDEMFPVLHDSVLLSSENTGYGGLDLFTLRWLTAVE
ncbi:MAG: hypothetical protein IPH78_09075 [Bacteroidetes bacterium]|nr:hypothetical protein [Bacteroidota bacterium]